MTKPFLESTPKPWDSVLRHLIWSLRSKPNLKDFGLWTDMNLSILSPVVARTKACPLKHAFRLASFFDCEISDLFGKDGLALRFDKSRFCKAVNK